MPGINTISKSKITWFIGALFAAFMAFYNYPAPVEEGDGIEHTPAVEEGSDQAAADSGTDSSVPDAADVGSGTEAVEAEKSGE